MTSSDMLGSPSLGASDVEDDNDVFLGMDLEVSKYPFIERLHHYMERNPIGECNCKSEEVAIMVEAGSIVREMGTMTKERRETVFYQEYLNIILEIPHEHFEEDVGRVQMQLRFKGMRKGGGDMNPVNLLRSMRAR